MEDKADVCYVIINNVIDVINKLLAETMKYGRCSTGSKRANLVVIEVYLCFLWWLKELMEDVNFCERFSNKE